MTWLLSSTFLILSLMLLKNKTFISIEIPMINMMTFNIPISIILDWMSCLFMSTVLFISSMILMFSVFYIPKKEQKQFSMLMLMFILSMSLLIISDNIIFMLMGWDGLGLSSYILIIYYQNPNSSSSGSITILSNRLGDIMILLSISIIMMSNNWNFNMNEEFSMISLMLITIAACSKSAQYPFSAWLPAAMAAPTPISALVHSSTLVTAGVYLMIRTLNNLHPTTMMLLMIVSSATTIYSSLSANWEQDMKKIIALSTLSQIAMMMFAVSTNSTTLAYFHLITHALFKSMMFLCAGTMIHNSSYQDMRMMGMNFYNSPLTSSILGISSLALMAIPFMSGFFSKDSILENTLYSNMSLILSMLMITSVGLTATYSTRMVLSSNNLFSNNKTDSSIHHSNMADLPISIMAPLSIISGSTLTWLMNPEQLFMLSTYTKLSILLLLFIGMILGMILSFKSKNFKTMGQSAISLWFNHTTTTFTKTTLNFPMNMLSNNDKLWQELYGPQGTKLFLMKNSSMLTMTYTTLMFTLIMTIMIPPMLTT